MNFEQVEASLRAARRRSRRRLFFVIVLIVVIWGGTYFYTKGEFNFFTKRTAASDTLVIFQTAELDSLSLINAQQDALITILRDSLHELNKALGRYTSDTAAIEETKAAKLMADIQLREDERKRREKILLERRRQYEQYSRELEQAPPPKDMKAMPQ